MAETIAGARLMASTTVSTNELTFLQFGTNNKKDDAITYSACLLISRILLFPFMMRYQLTKGDHQTGGATQDTLSRWSSLPSLLF